MNSKGGCCIERYGGGGGRMTDVEKIMLKFRPIAPKPVAAGSGPTTENSDGGYVKCSARSKRKYVRVVNKNNKKKQLMNNYYSKRCNTGHEKMKVKTSSSSPPLVTLSLLPETPDRKECSPVTDNFSDLLTPVQTKESCIWNNNNNKRKSAQAESPAPAVWLSFENQEQKACYGHTPGRVDTIVMKPTPPRRPQVVSYVTVECVTETWAEVEGLGCTDEERMMNMEKDTCPGFISDGQDHKVVWTNMAFKQMVGVEDMAVVLVQRDIWSPTVTYQGAFSCKVKVTTSTFDGHRRQTPPPSLMLPCDVWRMECGACAWRLDVKAALSLGR